jgi:hypothetical protein
MRSMRLRRGLRAFGGRISAMGAMGPRSSSRMRSSTKSFVSFALGSEEMESRLEELESRLGSRQT